MNPGGLLDDVTILQAARATSAASSYFEPISIGRNNQEFLDAGPGQNNPVKQVWLEAMRLWANADNATLENKLQFFISIGTGVPEMKPFGTNWAEVARTLVDVALDTQRTALEFANDHERLRDALRYIRLNVDRGLGNIGLEKADMRGEIADATMHYGNTDEVQYKLRMFKKHATSQGEEASHTSQ